MSIEIWKVELLNVFQLLTGWTSGNMYMVYGGIGAAILPLLLMSWVLGESIFSSMGGILRVLLGLFIPFGFGVLAYAGSNIYLGDYFQDTGYFILARRSIVGLIFFLSILFISKPLMKFGFIKTLCTLFLMMLSVYGSYHLAIKWFGEGELREVGEEILELSNQPEKVI